MFGWIIRQAEKRGLDPITLAAVAVLLALAAAETVAQILILKWYTG